MYNHAKYELGSTGSTIRTLFEHGRKQAAVIGKENVFDFSLGNPSIPSPQAVDEAIVDIIHTGNSLEVHSYTSAAGYDGAREAVADDLTERMGMKIFPHNLFFTCGAAPALTSVFSALHIDQNTEILAIAPFFLEYRVFVEATGSHFDFIPADTENFQIDFVSLKKMLSPHTQAVIVNTPNNPSGVVYSRKTLETLSQILTEKSAEYGHPIYLVSDEPYRELVYDGTEVPWIPSIYKDTIVCYSYSKSLSLPGERIGYVCVPDCVTDTKEIYAAVAGSARVAGHVCPPSLIQKVVARCAKEKPDLKAYDLNRRLIYEGLTEIGYECVKPEGAFYLFVKAPNGDAKAFSDQCKEKNLLIVPGDEFGTGGYCRLSYCVAKETIERSLPVFREIFET